MILPPIHPSHGKAETCAEKQPHTIRMPSEIIKTPRQARRPLGFVSSNANEPDVRPFRYAESPHKTPEILITKEKPSDAAHLVLFIISYALGFDLALSFETC